MKRNLVESLGLAATVAAAVIAAPTFLAVVDRTPVADAQMTGAGAPPPSVRAFEPPLTPPEFTHAYHLGTPTNAELWQAAWSNAPGATNFWNWVYTNMSLLPEARYTNFYTNADIQLPTGEILLDPARLGSVGHVLTVVSNAALPYKHVDWREGGGAAGGPFPFDYVIDGADFEVTEGRVNWHGTGSYACSGAVFTPAAATGPANPLYIYVEFDWDTPTAVSLQSSAAYITSDNTSYRRVIYEVYEDGGQAVLGANIDGQHDHQVLTVFTQ